MVVPMIQHDACAEVKNQCTHKIAGSPFFENDWQKTGSLKQNN
jgi:hypothetical protein